jgi:hypothetical protein
LTLTCRRCDNTPCSPPSNTLHYFELWQVNQGDIRPFSIWSADPNARNGVRWNDMFFHCGQRNTCGTFSIDAEVGYLQGYHPQQYPGYWVRTKPPRRAFHANDDPCDPAWRRIMSTVGPWGLLYHNLQDGPVVSPGRQWNSLKDKVSHSIDASWDCCGCPKKDFCPDPDGPECVP